MRRGCGLAQRSVAQGWRAGVLSALGICSGCVVHTLAAAFGLSALLAASPSAFSVLQAAGALYLALLGARMLLDRSSPGGRQLAAAGAPSAWAIYCQGVLTNVLNPKVALFYLAFLPQFIDPASASKMVSMLFLGALFVCNSTLYCVLLACFASAAGRRLRESPAAGRVLQRLAGALFVALGVRLAAGW